MRSHCLQLISFVCHTAAAAVDTPTQEHDTVRELMNQVLNSIPPFWPSADGECTHQSASHAHLQLQLIRCQPSLVLLHSPRLLHLRRTC